MIGRDKLRPDQDLRKSGSGRQIAMRKVSLAMLADFGRKIAYKVRRKLNLREITIEGVRLTAEREFVPASIRKQLLQKRYETPEYLLVSAAVKPTDRVLELGAGIGFISLVCAKICGPENVLSYEPNPQMQRVIEKNYALNRLQPNLRNRLVSVEAGTTDFFVSENVLSSSMIDRNLGSKTKLQADAMSDVVAAYQPTVIVMDVEGAELELLRNCSLDGVSKIIVEMHPTIVGHDEVAKLLDFLSDKGLETRRVMGKTFYLDRVAR
ncbi:FkbM family methyltransferase [Roseibium sp. MMSF_3412]|uniref:FkbM family methyltransferase n=1 Tax=Roseibium sp. MMSF_3412 TaxID=3046712 RepID=UPI00273D0A2B|nr:FkbM family methyltransferase [Roseibium sp. MMSF_3412]